MTESPPDLQEHFDVVADELAASDGLLLALDFDGTLAPIVDHPDDAYVPEETLETLDVLDSHDQITVAVVSGRALADLRERVEATAYAGNRGMELATDEAIHVAEAAEASRDALANATDSLTDRLADVDGAFVERKDVTATVHYRLADENDVPIVNRAVAAVADRHDEIRVTEGKEILELRPDIDWDKGDAVDWLLADHVPDDERWCPVYVGDDTTDEDAFDALPERGFGIKVGDRPTAADYHLSDPDAATTFLSWIAANGREYLDSNSLRTDSVEQESNY